MNEILDTPDNLEAPPALSQADYDNREDEHDRLTREMPQVIW